MRLEPEDWPGNPELAWLMAAQDVDTTPNDALASCTRPGTASARCNGTDCGDTATATLHGPGLPEPAELTHDDLEEPPVLRRLARAASLPLLNGLVRVATSGPRERRLQAARSGILCSVHPSDLGIGDADGYYTRSTHVLIATDIPVPRALRLLAAFDRWIGGMDADARVYASSVWNWSGPGTLAYGSQEIFGPEAAGAFLVSGSLESSWASLALDAQTDPMDAPFRRGPVIGLRERPSK